MTLDQHTTVISKERNVSREFFDPEMEKRVWQMARRQEAVPEVDDHRAVAGMRSPGGTGLRLNPSPDSNVVRTHRTIDRSLAS